MRKRIKNKNKRFLKNQQLSTMASNEAQAQAFQFLKDIYEKETGHNLNNPKHIRKHFEVPYTILTGRENGEPTKHKEALRFKSCSTDLLRCIGDALAQKKQQLISPSYYPKFAVLMPCNPYTRAEQVYAMKKCNLSKIETVIVVALPNKREDKNLTDTQTEMIAELLECDVAQVERRWDYFDTWIVLHTFGPGVRIVREPHGNTETGMMNALAVVRSYSARASYDIALFANVENVCNGAWAHAAKTDNIGAKFVHCLPENSLARRGKFFGDSEEIATVFAVQDFVRTFY